MNRLPVINNKPKGELEMNIIARVSNSTLHYIAILSILICLAMSLYNWNKAKRLEQEAGIKAHFQEEDFTSKQAVEKMVESGKPMMRRRKEIDMVSACLILENWLSSCS